MARGLLLYTCQLPVLCVDYTCQLVDYTYLRAVLCIYLAYQLAVFCAGSVLQAYQVAVLCVDITASWSSTLTIAVYLPAGSPLC
jgi:hypothetical protein